MKGDLGCDRTGKSPWDREAPPSFPLLSMLPSSSPLVPAGLGEAEQGGMGKSWAHIDSLAG